MPTPDVRLLAPDEPSPVYGQLARLHAQEISGGFLTSLGPGLLATLYRSIGGSPQAFIIAATEGSEVVGFICASTDTSKVYRHALARVWPRLLPALALRVFSWGTVRRCWETLRYPARAKTPDLPAAEILNFCVTRQRQRSGLGRMLFAAMEAEFRRRGVRKIRIVTGAAQLSAIRFYEKLGAEPAGSFEVHARVESRIFRHTIQDC
jgi:ribosomal protein S18 acetylase RimI-like enzyme